MVFVFIGNQVNQEFVNTLYEDIYGVMDMGNTILCINVRELRFQRTGLNEPVEQNVIVIFNNLQVKNCRNLCKQRKA